MGKYDFKQVGGSKVFRPWGHWTEGDSIVGKYSGTSEDNFGNTNYEIIVEECEFDEEVVTSLNAKKEETELVAPKVGEIFVLNSCGSLENAFEKIDIDDMVKVIYTGTIVLSKGKFAGKKAHTMKVLRAGSGATSKAKTTTAPSNEESVGGEDSAL